MARIINRLNARAVATTTKPGRQADGGGSYLSICPNGGRRRRSASGSRAGIARQ
jgi:hypothetical protein